MSFKLIQRDNDDGIRLFFRPHETFVCCDYKDALDKLIKKRAQRLERSKEMEKNRCKSAPAIPSSCHNSGDIDEKKKPSKLPSNKSCGRKPSCEQKPPCEKKASMCSDKPCVDSEDNETKKIPRHRHCITKDKYPCCDHDSDEEKNKPDEMRKSRSKPASTTCQIPKRQCEQPKGYDDMSEFEEEACESESKLDLKTKRKRSSKRSIDCPEKPKKGFLTKCCPCLVKKPVIRPISQFCSTKTTKLTQTTSQDLKCAMKTLRAAIKEEKKRQVRYGKNKKVKESSLGTECTVIVDESCLSEDELKKKDTEYRKARDKYRQRRRQMEENIIKEFEKEQKAFEKNKCLI